MIFEHEIPAGSRLYFGKSAQIKRDIESKAADLLTKEGYEEIVTPLFSYQQHESFPDRRPLIRLNDADNHEVSLRADSTADVVRLVTRRLGRTHENKRWFYIQPVFTFPTTEQYQVGAEVIGGEFVAVTRTALSLVESLALTPLVQIANIAIPRILSEEYGIAIADIEAMHIDAILASGYAWIEPLVRIHTLDDLQDLSRYPEAIATELARIRDAAEQLGPGEVAVSPLYFARLRYYDALLFRMTIGNDLIATGGTYRIEKTEAAGFALYIDACIAQTLTKDTHA